LATLPRMGAVERCNVSTRGPEDGPPLVFVHGFGCDQGMWRHVVPAFADRFRVVLLDLVGFGGSDVGTFDPERHGSLQGHADDVLDVCAELDLGPARIVGHSVGAMIAVRAAVTRPEAVDRLVLVCPSPRYIDDEGYVGGFSQADVDDLLASLDANHLGWSTAMAPVIMGRPDQPELGEELASSFCRSDPRIMRAFARVTFLSDSRADLPQVPVPTLVLQSKVDAIAAPAVGAYVRDHIPGAEMTVLDAVGHCPNLSAPDETVAAIEPFLTAQDR
jgi:sigma-B regulation protein RsbQ